MFNNTLFGFNRLFLLDFLGGTSIKKTLLELENQQYLPTDTLKRIQNEKFNILFKIATSSTQFYKSTQSYDTLEVLEKPMIRDHFSSFIVNGYNKKLFAKFTGGSSGIPFKYLTTVESRSFMWAGIILSWKISGYKIGDKIAFIAGSSILKSSFKHKIFYKIFNINIYSVFDLSNESIKLYLDNIYNNKTKIIYGYATAINCIANYIHLNGYKNIPFLKGIICTAEIMTDSMRQNIENAFNVKVYNQYGCNEAGVSAFECEYNNMHLINTRSFYNVDSEGNLISTDLSNKGFILLKYKTGDQVKFSNNQSCHCNRNFPIIGEINGRTGDIIVDKNSNTIHYLFFNILFRNDMNITQFQISYDKTDLNINIKVKNKYLDNSYFDNYISQIKKKIHFDHYNLLINQPFIQLENAKHSPIVKITI